MKYFSGNLQNVLIKHCRFLYEMFYLHPRNAVTARISGIIVYNIKMFKMLKSLKCVKMFKILKCFNQP